MEGMRRVILERPDEDVSEKDIQAYEPIFVMENNILVGMVVKDNEGWIIKLGGVRGVSGHHSTRHECMNYGLKLGFSYITPKAKS